MTDEIQLVFEELFDSFLEGRVISVELQQKAYDLGINIEAVENAALAYYDGELEDE